MSAYCGKCGGIYRDENIAHYTLKEATWQVPTGRSTICLKCWEGLNAQQRSELLERCSVTPTFTSEPVVAPDKDGGTAGPGPCLATLPQSVAQVQAERGAVYGDLRISQDAQGLILTALLESYYQMKLPVPVPGRVVALFMAGMKECRAAVPHLTGEVHDDNYLDALSYIDIALKLAKEEVEG